jgi:hypothetical protein
MVKAIRRLVRPFVSAIWVSSPQNYFKYPLTGRSDGVPPYAHVELPRLVLQQRYAISVDLQLPATEMNLALGNFMMSLLVLSSKNKTLAYVRRPVCVSSSWKLETLI